MPIQSVPSPVASRPSAPAANAQASPAEPRDTVGPALTRYPDNPALVAWAKTAPVQSLPALFRAVAARQPQEDYLGHKVGQDYQYLTYGEAQQQVQQFASALVGLGLQPGDRVATFSDNRVEWPLTDLGTMHAGCVHAPLYFNLAAESVEYILNDAGARVVVVDSESKLKKILEVEDRLPHLEHIVMLEPTGLKSSKHLVQWSDLLKAGEAAMPQNGPEIERRVQALKATDISSMVYTSGTTGHPKGVLLAHGNFLSNVEGVLKVANGNPQETLLTADCRDDVALSFLPLAHALERSVLYTVTANGGAVAYPESVGHFARDLKTVKPTLIAGSPLLLNKVFQKTQRTAHKQTDPAMSPQVAALAGAGVGAAVGALAGALVGAPLVGAALGAALGGGAAATGAAKVTKADAFDWSVNVGREYFEAKARGQVSGWLEMKHRLAHFLVARKTQGQVQEATGGQVRLFISGGAPLRSDVAAFLFDNGYKVSEGYGLSETSPVITVNPPDAPKVGTVGPAIPGVEVKLADDGEILTRGPHVMNGYLNKPDKTAETVDAEGWLHTGDIGTMDGQGYLRITDRKKNLLVLATGKKVAPAPIEALLTSSPYVQEAVVVGDNRTHVGALLVPDFENLEPWAKGRGLATDKASLAASPEVKELLRGEAARLTAHLSSYEQVRSVAVLPRELSVDEGELTPTMKVVRGVVTTKYRDLIEGMY